MIVLDAGVLIAFLDAHDRFHVSARAALTSVLTQPFRASVVTLAEVLVRPTQVGALTAARGALNAIGVSPVAIDSGAPERLAELRARTGLKLPDCCVILAAEQVRAAQILTFDDRLRQAAHAAGFEVGT